MLSALLLASLILTAPEKGVEEAWEGTLSATAYEFKPGKKALGPGKSIAETFKLTITIKRKGNSFRGEWIEGDRVLEIEGTIKGRKFLVTDKSIKSGEWRAQVVASMEIAGEFDKRDPGKLRGQILGEGPVWRRTGEFKVARSSDAEDD